MPRLIKVHLNLLFNPYSIPSGAVIHASIKSATQYLFHLWQAVQDSIIRSALWADRMVVILALFFRVRDFF